jgi:nitrogen fixation protein NifU and related proteins
MTKETEVFDDLEGLILADARKTYSQPVIDHFLHPRNSGEMKDADSFNAMSGICGDTIGIYVGVEAGSITRISFVTDGCGPTIACSSALTSMVKGLTVEEARKISGEDLIKYLGGLPRENTHCADLAVNTLRSALAKVQCGMDNVEEAKLRAILVVDESDRVSHLIEILSKHGISTTSGAKAGEALEECRVKPPQLAVVGSDLADMTGIRFLAELLKVSWTTSTILISDEEEEIIHDRTEGLGILGSIKSVQDVEGLERLLAKFHVMVERNQ